MIDLLWLNYVSLTLLKIKEKRRECFARKQIGGDQSEANGGADFFLENNFLFPLKFKETKRKNCPVKASNRSLKTIKRKASEPEGELRGSTIYKN